MPYNHGIGVIENPTSIPAPVSTDGHVPVFIGTSQVNLAENVADAVNKPVLCKNFAEFAAKLGYSEDYAASSLSAAADAMFKAFGVGPAVFINVLDPATQTTRQPTTRASHFQTRWVSVLQRV